MPIQRIIVKNYRTLKQADVAFNDDVNIIVGNNEAGKSTLLEAINLALKCQLNRRPAQYELHPYLINAQAVADFLTAHKGGTPVPPPEALIEVYFKNTPDVADLVGSINSQKVDAPGISLAIRLDEDSCLAQYNAFVGDIAALNGIPIEYYEIVWMSFAGAVLSAQSVPVKAALIDPSNTTNSYAANKYVLEIVRDYLTKAQAGELALAYRTMRDRFQEDPRIDAINKELAGKKKGGFGEDPFRLHGHDNPGKLGNRRHAPPRRHSFASGGEGRAEFRENQARNRGGGSLPRLSY
ncbi:AAA family ATPase [Labrys sp. 22185]|uniref:AAA family ATPase n=1 Tax=Labrys sp. 22185 TaxID=3453888 RepID=UPI003F85DF14